MTRHPFRFRWIPVAVVCVIFWANLSAEDIRFGTCQSPATGSAEDVSLRSLYIPMPDGVRLAADVVLPRRLPEGTRLPAILIATRYWRATEGQPLSRDQRFWLDHGYAVVSIDVRGTGASFGRWPYPWSRDEVRDLGDVVRWIVSQPWSDGKVGSIGTSYTANTAQLVAVSNHPAAKAVLPRFMDFDLYTDLVSPGGVMNAFIVRDWGRFVRALDENVKRGQPPRGVRPVEEDREGQVLAVAVREHSQNPPVEEMQRLVYRDQKDPRSGGSIDDMSTHRYRHEIERSNVPIFGWASWLDAGTANGVLHRYVSWKNPQRAIIGPWSHGGGHHASPYLPENTPTDPSFPTQTHEALCFIDQHVKGRSNGMEARVLFYYTLGEEKWKSTTAWPIPSSQMQRWYLGPENTLQQSAPATGSGSDEYNVDFEATTGRRNRWYTQLGGGDVVYPDRVEADRRLLTYTSAPLASDTEITGHPVLMLHVTSTASDGAFFVYLEDVDEAGKVTYVTEGMLRALHRKLSREAPPYRALGPYHSFKQKDGQPLIPGQTASLHLGLFPTSVLIKKGHRIRIALAGADKDTFARIPSEGTPSITIERNRRYASYVDLPVVSRDADKEHP